MVVDWLGLGMVCWVGCEVKREVDDSNCGYEFGSCEVVWRAAEVNL